MSELYMIQPNLKEEITDKEEFLEIYGYIYDYLNHDSDLEENITAILQEGLDGSSEEKVGKVLKWKVDGKIQNGIIRYQYSSQKDKNDGINIAQVTDLVHDVYGKHMYEHDDEKNKNIMQEMIQRCAKDKRVKHMGVVYTLTLVYFMTKGKYPIYDKYAYIALLRLNNRSKNIYTENDIKKDRPDQTENMTKILVRFDKYKEKSDKIYRQFAANWDDAVSLRKIDKALWAYGHLFYRNE